LVEFYKIIELEVDTNDRLQEEEMSFWENAKKDFQQSLKESVHLLKEKAIIIKEKADELTEEGKKRYKIFDIQMRIQKEVGELGGRIYDLSSRSGNPLLDRKVKTLIARIKKLESLITKLKGKNKKKSTRSKASQKKRTKKKELLSS
jgi:hypothetical protein